VGRDRWSAAGLGLLAIGYLLAGRRYSLDSLATPGPGLVPLVTGVALLAVAVWLFVTSGRVAATRIASRPSAARAGVADPATPTGPSDAPPLRGRWSPLALAAALAIYAAILPALGFVVSSFALVVVASRLMGAPGWWRPALLALGVTGVSYLLFARWLGVPLP
jgi:hypothetical protein